MPGIDFREARARVRIAEVLALMGLEPRRVLGGQARGPCPLHRSQSPTSRVFAVHLDKNVYHCFRCGAGGNALDLWAAWTRQSLYAAVVDLYQRLGRDLPRLASARRQTAAALSACRQRTNEETKPMPDP
jgi:DNA primase